MRVMARLVKSLGFDGSFCILRGNEWVRMIGESALVDFTLENRGPRLLGIRHFGSAWVQSAEEGSEIVSVR